MFLYLGGGGGETETRPEGSTQYCSQRVWESAVRCLAECRM